MIEMAGHVPDAKGRFFGGLGAIRAHAASSSG
jgi:hypothetical protein